MPFGVKRFSVVSVGLSEQSVKERIGAALRARAGDFNRKGWIAELADDIGVSERQVKNWFYGHHTPGGAALLDLFAHLGPDFTNEILEPIGLQATHLSGISGLVKLDAVPVAALQELIEKYTDKAA